MLECSKSDLVQTMLCLNNEPYSLKDRAPMLTLYNLQENDVLLMMGRQYGKSTFIASDSLIDSFVMPFFNTLYVSPRKEQTSEFSNSKLLPFIRFSPTFRAYMLNGPTVQNVSKRTFTNGSSITLKYAFLTADAIRGVSADKVTIDEIQDIIMDNVPIIEECLSGSRYQWRTYAGTPKTVNNTLARLWARSTQNEWIMKCPHCNKWNILGMENIGPKYMVCKKCGKELSRDAEGQWVAKKHIEDKDVYLSGFRVPQIISPTAKWSKIIEKLNTYPNAKFMNEVMALPCDSSANPISESELRVVCDDKRPMALKRTPHTQPLHLFLGVDWGHGDVSVSAQKNGHATGYTVCSLGCYDWDGKFKLLGMHKFTGNESDPIYQVEYIKKLATQLSVMAVGVDWGAGFMHNAQLKQMLDPDRVIEWQASDSLRVNAKWIPEAGRMVFNRTECMTDRFVEIKNKKVEFFRWEEFKEFAQDFLTICVEFRSNGGQMYYDHVLPDDAFHSYMICKMTADHLLRTL